jgi:hypothetical protein
MTYRAKMQNGEVVFEGGIKPADGVEDCFRIGPTSVGH